MGETQEPQKQEGKDEGKDSESGGNGYKAFTVLLGTTAVLLLLGAPWGFSWPAVQSWFERNIVYIAAILPGATAFLYKALDRNGKWKARLARVKQYANYRHDYDKIKRGSAAVLIASGQNIETLAKPHDKAAYGLGAIVLTIPFLLLASLSDESAGLGPQETLVLPGEAATSDGGSPSSPVGSSLAGLPGGALLSDGGTPPPSDGGTLLSLAGGGGSTSSDGGTPPPSDGGTLLSLAGGGSDGGTPPPGGNSLSQGGSGSAGNVSSPAGGGSPEQGGNGGLLASLRQDLSKDPGSSWRVQDPKMKEGLAGLMFAGYGVFIYVLGLLIYRINASALSPKFLMNSALRSIIMMMLGFAAGRTQIFAAFASDGQRLFLYFAIGMFPNWAYLSFRKKVVGLFKPLGIQEEALSLELVEGITSAIAERLEEINISDIQHLAMADPGDLSLRTLYPIELCLDWIDQAILITYMREKIVYVRQAGMRGAIDMSGAYIAAVGEATQTDGIVSKDENINAQLRSQVLLRSISERSLVPLATLYNIGESLAYDYQVRFLFDFWHHEPIVPDPKRVKAIADALKDSGVLPQEPSNILEERKRVDAIAAALKASGLLPPTPTPGDQLSQDFAQKLQAAAVDFSQKLDEQLMPLHLKWKGKPEDLKGATTLTQLFTGIIKTMEDAPPPPPA